MSPAEPLQAYIENYWFVSHEPDEDVSLRVDVFVDARPDLIFNFESPYVREIIGGEMRELSQSNLDAQRLVPIRIRQHGPVRIAGVRFRLGGLGPFSRGILSEWSGRTPPPARILDAAVERLEEDLRHSTDAVASAQLLDTFFSAALRVDDAQRAFERSLTALVQSDGRAGTDELAAVADTSPRQIQRLFSRRLGFAPTTVGRVVRFQTALRRLMVDPQVALGDIAAVAGYFDQAHFVRDFRAFTGGVPRGYRGYYPPEGPDDFAPNVVAYIQDGGGTARGE